MGGGLLQLVAYGAQDVYLTGNPQITFFKVVYRRHTNFAMESIYQTFNGNPSWGNRVTCQISRNGDLIHYIYLQLDLPASSSAASFVEFVGLRAINYVELEIGGQRIDKHYADWLYIWHELTVPVGKEDGFRYMTGYELGDNSSAQTLYVPLQFWFCRNVGLALPLIALQYHEVKINIQFETLANVTKYGSIDTTTFGAQLWVDYIYLDTDERRRFAQLSHEYLIEQLQFTGDEVVVAGNNRIKLNFNHPTKELVWAIRPTAVDSAASNLWFNYTTNTSATDPDSILLTTFNGTTNLYPSGTKNVVTTPTLLQLNGHDRFYARDGIYFNKVQPFQHHENVPRNPGINVYSFALKPEEHQPSGTLNFSRIDTAVLSVQSLAAGTLKVFAVNYNILRVMSGMGGLAYSN